MAEDLQYNEHYLKGIEYFNDCQFFEAHDAWEELWMEYQGSSRKFYQGLIQMAVCLHHYGNGNVRGAKKLFHSSSNYLSAYAPWHEGIDLEKLLGEFQSCCAAILASQDEFPNIEIDPELIPEIHLQPTEH